VVSGRAIVASRRAISDSREGGEGDKAGIQRIVDVLIVARVLLWRMRAVN